MKPEYRIYCDESWNWENGGGIDEPYFVFHGVLVRCEDEEEIAKAIEDFRVERGYQREIKWEDVESEYKNSSRRGLRSRCEDYLDRFFFRYLRQKKLSFGAMYLPTKDYLRVEKDFTRTRNCHKHDYFFMLYYQFLAHCFIKTQVRNKPLDIIIDNRSLKGSTAKYDIERFRTILNRKHTQMQRWNSQLELDDSWLEKVRDAVRTVELLDSRHSAFVQLADLVAGCFRYIRENNIYAPVNHDQFTLFEVAPQRELKNGRDYLADYFLRELRSIEGYQKLNLCETVWKYHFNIFPFKFKRSLNQEQRKSK